MDCRICHSDRLPAVLLVGTAEDRHAGARTCSARADISEADFPGICDIWSDDMPDIVVAPLFSRGFDSFDVARFLHHRGYRGMLRIVSAPLPRPDMVLSELRLAFPGLRMDIVTVTAAQAVRVA